MAARRKRKTTTAVVRVADATNAALDYKRQGKSIREIAVLIDYSVGQTHKLIEDGIRGIPAATRDALVAEVHERQLAIIDAHWLKKSDPESAKVIQAADKLLMALLGLEAPKQSEITGKDGTPLMGEAGAHDDVLRSLAALAAAAAAGSGDPKPDA